VVQSVGHLTVNAHEAILQAHEQTRSASLHNEECPFNWAFLNWGPRIAAQENERSGKSN
jgi:hypothetical protein